MFEFGGILLKPCLLQSCFHVAGLRGYDNYREVCWESQVEDRDVHDQRVQGQPPERIAVLCGSVAVYKIHPCM